LNHSLTSSPGPESPRNKPRTFRIVIGALILLLALLAVRHHRKKKAQTEAQQTAISALLPIVNAAAATRGATKHYLNALGTVTPLNSVVVRSRIDGQLMKVYFHEGELVREGTLLAEIDPRPGQVSFTQAHGQLIRDQASLAQAEMDLHRYEPLAQHQAIPQQQKDQQVSLVQQYRGAVEADQGQVDNANLTLIYSRITAPLSGRIGLRLVDPGNIVHASDTGGILTITQVAPITVVFNLAEDDLPKLQRALQANPHISVEAWDRANQIRIASGRILSLDNSIDPTSGTLKIKAVFDNKVATLFPNEFVNIRVETDVRQDALLVPDTAVQRNGDTAYVYVLSNDQTVHVRPVQVGSSNEGRVEILSGLQNGDVVVVKGFDKLQDAIRVSTTGNENARQSGNVQ
jgi:membrane fusion protein, multidrug efflux system